MQIEDLTWGEDYRLAARQALAELLEGRMAETIGISSASPTRPGGPA